ncbi:MAG: metal-sensing transcriptional repressor [Chloroflexi bacterium]|nr:metal-sensing transcriptional repressor [Chloroflexota bacterium]
MRDAKSHGEHKHTKEVINRLSRIEGHVRAVKGMVAEGRACPDVLIQLAAIRSAVEQVSRVILSDHVESCLRGAAATGDADDEWVSLKEALDRFIS